MVAWLEHGVTWSSSSPKQRTGAAPWPTVRAAVNHRSMEEEVRIIPRDVVTRDHLGPRNLATFTRECFASVGGVDLELPTRGPMREPPDFS